jgi:hypothetical protein
MRDGYYLTIIALVEWDGVWDGVKRLLVEC